MAGYRYLVSGDVQGVGFRWFVARHARALGLGGYARNLPNGDVEVVVAGPDDALPTLEDYLRSGPASARVARVEQVETLPEMAPANRFDII